MSKTTVLIGFAEALAAPEVLWSLVDGGFKVIAFARRGRASALRYSRHVICHEICAPEKDIQKSQEELQSLLGSLSSSESSEKLVLFPLDDKAVWLCSKIQLNERWSLAGPSGPCADLALNKNVQVESAREAGLNVPNTALIRTSKEAFDFGEANGFPVILKAADCVPVYQGRVYSCRKWICANRGELDRAMGQWQEKVPLLAQSFVTGNGTGIFGLAAEEGVRAWSGHHRVRMMNPQGSGSSACESEPVAEALKQNAQRMIRNSGWRGLFMIEMLRDDAGNDWFVEINGRPWGSMALCRRQGYEYPAWHVELALNPKSNVGANAPSSRTVLCRHMGREFMHVLFVMVGAKSNALSKWPSFWRTIKDVLRFRKKDGYYNLRKDDLKVFFADFYYTVHDNVFKSKS